MADIQDLADFGKELTPVITALIDTWAQADTPGDTSAEDALIAKLEALVSGWPQVPNATLEARAGAIAALRTGLTDLLIKAATSKVALDETQVLTIQAQRDSLRSAFGRLLELSALTPIAGLLTSKDTQSMASDLKQARLGIQNKNTAKAVLDTVVDVAIIAGEIAIKLAA
jgi:hypothetical protein